MRFHDLVSFLDWWFRGVVPILVLWGQLPVPLFWLVVHPAIGFWRRHPKTCYYVVTPSVWLAVGVSLLVPYSWWVEERLTRHPLVALVGLVLIGVDLWLLRLVKRDLHWRVLVGLPELFPGRHAGRLAVGGVYERIRHPRYAGMMLAWLGAALLSGATRLLWLVVGFVGLAVVVTELEERELLRRLGEEYADYRRRVPRFVPRWPGRGWR